MTAVPGFPRRRALAHIAGWTAAAVAFAIVATLNTGGYRYGVGDQAFYIPAILRHLHPDFFPRDRALIDDQDRWTVSNGAVAAAVRRTGASLPAVFLAAYVAGLLLMLAGSLAVGRSMGLSGWGMAALAAALALRHRVGLTGVNTLEGYLHPRMVVWGLGMVAVALYLRGRPWLAVVVAAAALAIHPTTAMWFCIWIGVAVMVADRTVRRFAMAGAAVGLAVTVWAFTAGPLAAQMVRMDAPWLAVLAAKDYLFPTTWPASMWGVTGLYVGVVALAFTSRRRAGLADDRETGLVAGAFVLVAIFLVILPAVHARVAAAVQFQVSRVFWMLDFLAVVYAVWFAVDARRPLARSSRGAWRGRRIIAATVMLAAAARGGYVMFVEHPGRPVVGVSFPADEWQDVMAWLARTPPDAGVLADPGHAWRYGTSVRVSAERDVYLEEVKDSAMAMYSRPVAMRVAERAAALGDFHALTPERATALAARYGLTFLVTEQPLDLPVAYRNARFTIYRLGPAPAAAR